MTSWSSFAAQAPDLAALVRDRFDADRHKLLATVRLDGSPRLSGVEVTFSRGELWLGGMPGSRKCLDLRRDPRLALHSVSIAGSEAAPQDWSGDAKLSGRATEISDPAELETFRAATSGVPPGPFHLFRVALTEASVVHVGDSGDHLVIESWHEGRGRHRAERR